jgi:hypothetical protein
MKRCVQAQGRAWVETLSLLAVMGLLLVLLSAVRKTHTLDPRMPCGTSLSSTGKAILVYSNDYRDELP